MIAGTTLKYLQWYMIGGERLRVSLLKWEKSTGKFGITKSKLTWSIVLTLQVYLLMQFFFEVSQLYHLTKDPAEPLPNYMKLLSQCLSRLLISALNIDVFLHGEGKATFLNQIVVLDKRFNSVRGGDKIKDNFIKGFARFINFCTFIYPVLVAADFIKQWNQSRYWHHLVIPKFIFPFTLPFLGVLEYIVTVVSGFSGPLYFCIFVVYFRTSKAWLALVMKMQNCRVSGWKTNRLRMLRTLQVYNQIYNDRMAVVWTYQMGALLVIQVVCTAILLRFAFKMPFPTNGIFVFGACGSTFYSTKIYISADDTGVMSQELAGFYKKSKNKYIKAVGFSLKPLAAEVRPFFVMTETTAFAYSNEVLDKTVSILIST